MFKVNTKEHCSFNKDLRALYYKKQNVNNSTQYTEEEKKSITTKIEKDIYDIWERLKYQYKK